MSDILNSVVQNASGTDNTVLSEKKATRNIVITGAALTLLAMGLSFLGKEPLKLLLGFLLGGLTAQLVFYLNGKNVDRALKDPDKMALIQKGGYYVRLFIRAAVLLLAYFIPFTSITATFAGLMTVPAAIYLLTFVSVGQVKKQEKREGADDTDREERKEE